uniref:PDEase domain-containing protein n=1 Tax=Craspedostauros australis TaxID=1486917 RepID=A0A7R9ZSQ7_9STRA
MLGREVKAEIEEYVRTIASLYRDSNPFHNFSHASHVVQSTVKLLSRIVVGEDAINYRNMTYKKANGDTLHKTTYGIASDPLTQFSCILAALIHDVDHSGVPNAQLIKEQTAIASLYKNQSVAEQNSIDLSWDLMMGPQFEKFRSCIYKTREELDRFRQLLINAVLATDIVDKELGAFRKNRWNKAFSEKEQRRRRRAIGPMISSNSFSSIMSLDDLTMTDQQIEQVKQEKRMEEKNRMATIVIEHLIQASDVCHTMQHWNIYVKWNERLFDELYGAFLNGRAENDPSTRWYEGEIGFFDHYIIPLAHKLKECGVFGVSSDEYLKYAQANRKEWTIRGREAVARYMSKYNAKNSSMAKRLPASLISLDEKKEDMQSLSPKIPVRMLSKRVVQDDFDDMMSDTEAEHADDLLDGHGKAHDGDYDYDYDHDHNGDRIDLRRRGIPMEISASGDRSYDELVRLNDVDSECADFIVKHITIGGSTEFDDDDSVGTIDA